MGIFNKFSFLILLFAIVNFCWAIQNRQWVVGKVTFKGNENISSHALTKRMHLKPPALFQKEVPFSIIELLNDITSIEMYYKSKGYFNSHARMDTLDYDSTDNKVNISISIKEGHVVNVNRISILGKTGKQDLLNQIYIQKGNPLDSEKIENSRLMILDTLVNNGFWYADVAYNYKLDSANYYADLTYFVNRGPLVFAGDPIFNGFDKVKEVVARRELNYLKNKVLTTDLIQSSTRRLNETGLFSSIKIFPYDTLTVTPSYDSLALPLFVNVKEADMIQLSGGGGYDTYEKFYLSLLIGYKNLFGLGQKIMLRGKLSSKVEAVYLNYTFPWIFNKPINCDVTAFIDRENQPTFNGLFNGGAIGIDGKWGWNNSYTSRLRLDHTQWIHENSNVVTGDDSRKSTVAISGSLRKDTRINIASPGTALYANAFGELAGPFLPQTNQFYKYELDLRSYHSFKMRSFSISSAMYSGYVNGYSTDNDRVPQQELFRPGFNIARQVRGYKPNQIAPVNKQGDVIGGKYVFIINLIEFRFHLFGGLTGAIFVDGGKVFADLSEFTLNALRWSIGPGIMTNTPLGLLRVDYGIQLHPSPEGRILFSIGLPF